MSLPFIRHVEEMCFDSMESFGFVTYPEEKDYRQDDNSGRVDVSSDIPYILF